MQTIDIGCKTDRGQRRRRNEDAVLVRSKKESSGKAGPIYLLAVADGVGGSVGGSIASREAVRALADCFVQDRTSDPQALLRDGLRGANARIRRLADRQARLQGMCSTLVAAIVAKRRAWVANVGDSRAYFMRNGQIGRLTQDHTWVAEQVKAGQMTEEEAMSSPNRNIITRCVGSKDTLSIDLVAPLNLRPGDILLLCSDGLTGIVSEAEIASACLKSSPAVAAQELVDLANRRGGPDNISVVVGQAHDVATETAPTRMGRATVEGNPVLLLAVVVSAMSLGGGIP